MRLGSRSAPGKLQRQPQSAVSLLGRLGVAAGVGALFVKGDMVAGPAEGTGEQSPGETSADDRDFRRLCHVRPRSPIPGISFLAEVFIDFFRSLE